MSTTLQIRRISGIICSSSVTLQADGPCYSPRPLSRLHRETNFCGSIRIISRSVVTDFCFGFCENWSCTALEVAIALLRFHLPFTSHSSLTKLYTSWGCFTTFPEYIFCVIWTKKSVKNNRFWTLTQVFVYLATLVLLLSFNAQKQTTWHIFDSLCFKKKKN